MIKLEKVVLASPEQMEFVIEGMRNPMNSWDRSDSESWVDAFNNGGYSIPSAVDKNIGMFKLGPNDYNLMQRLADAGSVHRKYMRMMPVYVRITAPLYWWKEFDTYKVGTVSNSCSTMHKIQEKEFTLEDFSCDQLSTGFEEGDDFINSFIVMSDGDSAHDYELYPRGVLEIVIEGLNKNRKMFLDTRNKKYWWQMIQLLPSSYNQTRNVMMNYEVLANIYQWRKDHKLDEWREFCKWVEELPYSELITGLPIESDDAEKDEKERLCGEDNCHGKYCSVQYCICNDGGICNRRKGGDCLHPEDR